MCTIVTDTLQGKTSATSITLPTTTNIGSTPLVSASANSMTIRGEGSNTTNIQQGLAKCWVNFNGTSTPAARDSFNFASITDNGTGYYTIVFTNAMSNDDYCRSGAVGETSNSGANRILGIRLPATSGFNVATYNTSGGINDNSDICCLAHGDLA